VDASAHLGIDQEGNAVRMVPDEEKAWTSGDWNPRSLNIELIGFAKWKNPFWRREYRPGLRRAAQACARWSIKYDIPLRKRAGDGVCGHVHVSGPGGHWDPGPGFPWKTFLLWCKLERLRIRRKEGSQLERRWRRLLREMLKR
jgi:N-acetyl-anhydromuramyl-L-alanine amidase AmpD